MVIDYHADIGAAGAWSYTADEPPASGDEIIITHSSGLPGGDSMTVRVKSVLEDAPFAITASVLW